MTAEVLQELVASLGGKDKAQITAATPLKNVLQGSLGRVRLEAALRYRLGIANVRLSPASTFGDLCALLGANGLDGAGAEAASVQELPRPAAITTHGAARNGMHVGIDVQDLAALPEAADYWEHEFYKNTFSQREIAYALLQPSPRATFAGQWCAKEALRKANPGLTETAWTALEVVHDSSGKPAITIDGRPAAGSLSISHAGEVAVAVFVAAQEPEPAPAPQAAEPEPQTGLPGGNRKALALAVVALLLAVAALILALLR